MRGLRLILITALFSTPVVNWAQTNPNSALPDAGLEAPEVIIAQNSQSEAAPQAVPAPPSGPGIATVRAGQRIGRGLGPLPIGPPDSAEFGPALGAWWKNSEIVAKLQLNDEQVRKISQTFLDHKLKLIDLQADLDKQELRLQPLLDVDQPDESKVATQIDAITAARGRLEKENAMMMLDIRRWLSVEQWKKLKSLEPPEPGPNKVYFFRSIGPQGGPGLNIEGPLPPRLPEDMPGDLPAR
jgi:Spy/CpxP family protein refolding chaperone